MGTGQTTGLSLYNARPVHGAYIRLKPGHRARLMLVLGVATILGILLALCGPELVQHLLNNGIRKAIVWRPDSPKEVDERFRGPADPYAPGALGSEFSVWLLNITNVDQMRQGAKPHVEVVGPYIYRRIRRKVDTWWDKEGRVSVKEWSYYLPIDEEQQGEGSSDDHKPGLAAEGEAEAILQHSAADRSSSSSTGATSMGQAGKGGATSGIHSSSSSSRGGAAGAGAGAGKGASQGRLKQADLNATIVTLNLPLLGVVEAIHGAVGPAAARLLDLVVSVLAGWSDEHINGLFVKRTARELIWGYEDPLLRRLAGLLPPGYIPTTVMQLVHNQSSPQEALAGPRTLYNTGAKDISQVWNVEEDLGVSQVTSWPGGSACVERVTGTDAFQFAPGIVCGQRKLRVWVSELFRSGELVCAGEERLLGVRLLRYTPDPASAAPDACHGTHFKGLVNLTAPMAVGPSGNGSAAHGLPVYLSQPFYCGETDPQLRTWLDGLPGCGPDADVQARLGTFLDVEPITGIPMRAAKRVMLSSEITPAAKKHLEPKLNASIAGGLPLILPVFWAQEAVAITEEQAALFKGSVYWALRIKAHMRIWPLLASLGLAAGCVMLLVREATEWQQRAIEEDRARSEAAEARLRQQRAAAAGDGSGPSALLCTSAG